MDKDFVPKFSDIEKDWKERLKNDVSKYLPEKKEEIKVIKDNQPEEIKNSNLTLDNLKSSGFNNINEQENKLKIISELKNNLDKPNFLGLTRLEVLVIILIAVIGIGFYSWYNLGNNGKFSPEVSYNSTCEAQNITIPACPVAPTCPACPTPNIYNNFSLPNNLNITCSNHS